MGGEKKNRRGWSLGVKVGLRGKRAGRGSDVQGYGVKPKSRESLVNWDGIHYSGFAFSRCFVWSRLIV